VLIDNVLREEVGIMQYAAETQTLKTDFFLFIVIRKGKLIHPGKKRRALPCLQYLDLVSGKECG
jgi:hypothetical protein